MGSSVSARGAKEAEEKEEEKVVGEAIFSALHRATRSNKPHPEKMNPTGMGF
jgi:hypothetical protein